MDFSTIYQAGYNPSLWVGFFCIFQCEVKENMADYKKKTDSLLLYKNKERNS